MNAIVIVLSIVVIILSALLSVLRIRVKWLEKQSKKDRTDLYEILSGVNIKIKKLASGLNEIGLSSNFFLSESFKDYNHIPIIKHASRILEIENYLGIEWHGEQQVPAGYKKIEEPKPEENK